jgi:hypothetical protein
MRKMLFLLLLTGSLLSSRAQDSGRYFLHKFAQNIGQEVFYRTTGDSGVSYTIRFKFVDRGSPVPLDARLLMTENGEPARLWVKGNTSRFSTIHDSIVIAGGKAFSRVGDSSFSQVLNGMAFPVTGYSPGTVQMALLKYWNKLEQAWPAGAGEAAAGRFGKHPVAGL